MNNAEIFSQTFGIYATEMWAMPESEFLSWLNSLHDVNATNTTDTISKDKAIEAIDEVRDLISVNAYCAITERLKMIPTANGDLISRAEAIARATHEGAYGYISAQELAELPSAERVGHWIQISPAKIYECSECGQNVMTIDIERYKYCLNCGARMGGEGE